MYWIDLNPPSVSDGSDVTFVTAWAPLGGVRDPNLTRYFFQKKIRYLDFRRYDTSIFVDM